MIPKILTVDDSRAVRLIVRKALKSFECEVLDATNGEEGLAMAAEHKPNLILLDVTMPVMDGVEMLAKLKADPTLKGIYVVMLTAEAGREVVVKIAKLGVRDYIVKPFQECDLVEKIKQILDLKVLPDSGTSPCFARGTKSLQDACTVLLIEDQLSIAEGICRYFSKFPWKFEVAADYEQARLWVQSNRPDAIIASLNKDSDAALNFIRQAKADQTLKHVPCIATCEKNAVVNHQLALEAGAKSIMITPLDLADMELKLLQLMQVDASGLFFSTREHVLIVKIPGGLPSGQIQSIASRLSQRISQAAKSGMDRMVFNIEELDTLSAELIRLINDGRKSCSELSIPCRILAKSQLQRQCKDYIESEGWLVDTSLDASLKNN